ncbi:membrane-spanning 4-domains subfamily A member 4A [Salarias fasciatus]|uniref:membrane-spanning 4-domains subfamily A member 4A n=1 Tax=Salarias fasciatus TaxID=181472 RepID=UPI00117702BB|nr:membrane-spanning 4-domains subfamily A member 4A-like [Salarias fasciatus]
MASTSVTKVGGVVVVTQVIPKDEASLQLQAPPADQAPACAPQAPPPEPVKVDDMTAAFLQGQPLVLGVSQIFIGVMLVLFSLTTLFWWTLIIHLPFGLAFFFIISGSLAVAAGRKTSVPLVWASLASHLLSALVAVAGICYASGLMATQAPEKTICIPESIEYQFPDNPSEVWIRCIDQMWILTRTLYGLLGFALVLLVFQAAVSISLCVFSGKAARLRHTYKPVQTSCDGRPLLASP